jgi:hypothetical protein
MDKRVLTSVVLDGLVRNAPIDYVTLDWIVDHLSERSFGIVMLLIALVALIPGASPLAGFLLATIAFQMILARRGPILPRIVAARRLSTHRLVRLVERVVPMLKRIERLVRQRWHTPFEATKRAVGFVIMLLGATLLAPVPFSHVIPALVIMLLAFAFLEEDGVLLCVGLATAVISLCITIAAAWGTIEASLAI